MLKDETLKVRAFLVSDGRANVSLFGKELGEELGELAKALSKRGIELNIFETNGAGIHPGISYIPILEEMGAKLIWRGDEA